MQHPYQSAQENAPEAAARRLLAVYDTAARAAIRQDRDTVLQALSLLRVTLEPAPSPEVALSLAAIYSDVEQAVSAADFDAAARILEELKGLWHARFRLDGLL